MLILEIAAGIVLGVVALAALPALLGVLAALGIFVAANWPNNLYVCLTFAGFAAVIGLFGLWTHKDKRFRMTREEFESRQPKRPST